MNYELRKKSQKKFRMGFHLNSYFLIPNSNREGFSIIELVVAISIFFIITSVLMVSQRKFGGNILITNLAYDVALTMRQAQVYGISVKEASQQCKQGVETKTKFDCTYGVHFNQAGYFILFADIDGNRGYNSDSNNNTNCLSTPSSGVPECVKFFKVEKGNTIKGFCAGIGCTTLRVGGTNFLDLLFTRPNPEPTINTNSALNQSEATITVTSPYGLDKSVRVSNNGQISVQ